MTLDLVTDPPGNPVKISFSGSALDEFKKWALSRRIHVPDDCSESQCITVSKSDFVQIRKYTFDQLIDSPKPSRLTHPVNEVQIIQISQSAELWLMTANSLCHAATRLRDSVDNGCERLRNARVADFQKNEANPEQRDSDDGLRGFSDRDFLMAGPMLMLYGMSIEAILKARHIALNPEFDSIAEKGRWWTGHNIRNLATKTGWSLSRYTEEEMMLIDDLSRAIQLGRYPYHTSEMRVGFSWGWSPAAIVDHIVKDIFTEVTILILTQLRDSIES